VTLASTSATIAGPSVLFQLLVLLHIICAIGGFGAVAYRGLALDLGRRKGQAAAAGVLDVYGQISGVGEALVYGALVFGISAVAAGGNGAVFHRAWLPLAVAVYIAMVGLLHGLVKPAEKRYRSTMLELAQAPAVAPPSSPPQAAELDRLYRRVGAGAGLFNVLLLAALYLMVFRP
jgi:hypothetical protein